MAALRTYAALLRGVNVGGKRKLPMRELAELLGSLGYEDVRTYIQSGNVAFASTSRSAMQLEQTIEAAIAARFALEVTVLIRTNEALRAIEAGNPFAGAESEPSRLFVTFLDRPPTAAAVARLDPDRSPGDRFAVSGREIYLHLPNGAGRTKLTLDYLESRLGVAGTARNWNTLLKLIELTAPAAGG